MKHNRNGRKLLSIALSLLMVLSFAPLFGVTLQADAAVATNRNSSNYVYGHYYYYPEGTTFIKSIHVGYDKDKDKAQANAVNEENPNLLGQDWLDGMGSNIFKRYNYIYIAYGTTTDITQAWGTYIRMKHSSGTPATQNFVVNGQNVTFTLGSDVDFNEDRGSGSDYIYLYKTNDPRYGLPITEFRSGEGTADTDKWESYFLTAERDNTGEVSDFNRGAGGKYLWLHYGNYSVFTDVTTQVNALKAALDEAKAVDTSGATEASRQALQSAISEAQPIWDAYNANVYKCAKYDAAAIQAKTNALNNALNNLIAAYYTVSFNGAGNNGGSMTDQRIPINASRPLSANGFTREFTVNYNYNGATGGNAVTHDVAISAFNGWATTQYGVSVYSDRQSVQGLAPENGTVALYANWMDSSVTLPDPTKDGYTFMAWYSDPSLAQNYRVGFGGVAYTPPADMTLYAKWEETTYNRIDFTFGTGYSITQEPAATAKMTDTVVVKLKLDTNKYNCEPVLTCNTGTVEMLSHNAGALAREYHITGITEDYTISIGDAVPPTYTVTFVDSLSGEPLDVQNNLSLGDPVEAPAVDDYVVYNDEQHLKFTGWDKTYSPVNANLTVNTVYEAEDHTWGDGTEISPATCQGAGETKYQCVWCSQEKTETTPAGNHSFTRKVTTAAYLKTAATCTAPAEYYYCCANCDAKGETTYTSGSPIAHSLTKTEAKAATCTEGGWDEYWTCGECGRMFSDANGENRITAIPATGAKGHALSRTPAEPATCVAAGTYAYYTCSRCQKLFSDQTGENEITEAETIQPPTGNHSLSKTAGVAVTCETDGSIAYWTCSVCRQKFSDQAGQTPVGDEDIVITHTGHDFSAQVTQAKYRKSVATCTEPAVYYYSCANCGQKGAETFTDGEANGHDFYWVQDTAPTCVAPGEKHEKCRNCTETRKPNTVIPATGAHSYTVKTVKAEAKKSDATCTAPAVYYYSCAVCGGVEGNADHTFKSGSALGHRFGVWITDRAPTCTAEGAQHRTCSACSYTETGTIAKTSHVDANGDYACDECGADMTPGDLCPYCHGTHTGAFGWLIGFFHRILYFFKNLFG